MPNYNNTNKITHIHMAALAAGALLVVPTVLSSTLLNSAGFFKQTSPWKQSSQMAFAMALILEVYNYSEGTSKGASAVSKFLKAIDRIISDVGKIGGKTASAAILLSICNLLGYGMRAQVEDSGELVQSIVVGALTGPLFMGILEGIVNGLSAAEKYLDKTAKLITAGEKYLAQEETSSLSKKNN